MNTPNRRTGCAPLSAALRKGLVHHFRMHGFSCRRPQDVGRGDLVAVLTTGAYNYSMASNYNRIPRLPIVMVRDGSDCLAVRRESLDDIVLNDL